MELERQENVLVVCHQAILRCVLGYFMSLPQEELPYVDIPLHTVLPPLTFGGNIADFRY